MPKCHVPPPPPDPEGEAIAARMAEELSEFLARQVAEVEAYLATHFGGDDDEADDPAELALAAAQAALDDSAEGRALLRYEGQHGREFRATLNQLVKLTQTDADLVEDGPSPWRRPSRRSRPPRVRRPGPRRTRQSHRGRG